MADQTPEAQKRVSEVEEAYDAFRQLRLPHDQTWYVNRAMFRGQHYVTWSEIDQKLVPTPTTPGRIRLAINRIMPKVRARMAKFLKDQRVPVAVPATRDVKDKLNARGTTLAIDYQWKRCEVFSKYADALFNASYTGHGYFWYHWDETVISRVAVPGVDGAPPTYEEAMLGDIHLEVPSTFEILVEDPSISFIGDQPRIMRVRLMTIEAVKAKWGDVDIAAEGSDHEALRYMQRIGTLTSNGVGGFASTEDAAEAGVPEEKKKVLLKELFEKPCPSYPKGRYTAVANGVQLDDRPELPLGFWDLRNPYPCTDFPDTQQAGQYWIPTVLEQLIPLQREYNLLRSKLAEHSRVSVHPKVLVARQQQLQEGTWTEDAGEIVEYVAIPNVPPPQPWTPAPISGDVYTSIGMIPKEMDDVTHIFPESEGRVGSSSSGFQTNLLQEATDAVHAPDLACHQRALEEVARKFRRMMKNGWEAKRFISVAGSGLTAEAMEFSASNIDEHADLRIEAASGLPTMKAARVQMISELWTAGLLGSPDDPEAARRVRKMLEFGSIEDQYDVDKQDEEAARLENTLFEEGRGSEDAMFYENHDLHYRTHTDQLKSSSAKTWPPERRQGLIRHALTHVMYINPQSAIMLAQQYGFEDLLAKPEAQAAMQAPPAPPAGVQAPGPQGPEVAGAPAPAPTPPPVM